MRDLIDTARKAATLVVRVAFDLRPWNGLTTNNVRAIPMSHIMETKRLRTLALDNLSSRAIQCRDGAFLPKKSIQPWLESHLKIMSQLALIRDDILSKMDIWNESVRALSRDMAKVRWLESHPNDDLPPPTFLLSEENTAVTGIPSKSDIIGSFRASVRYGSHTFVFMDSGCLTDTISGLDLTEEAWLTVNELICVPYRILASAIKQEIESQRTNKRMEIKLVNIHKIISLFLSTELLGDENAISMSKRLLGILEAAGACNVDWKTALEVELELANIANRLSAVSAIVG